MGIRNWGKRSRGLLATRSTDGRTWSRPATLTVQSGSREGEYAGGAIAADPADPRPVYIVVPTFSYPSGPTGSFQGTVVFARSLDGGISWQPARTIVDTGAGRLTTGHQLVVLPGSALLDIFTLIDLPDLHASAPSTVRPWLAGPATMRLIGSAYDANNDSAYAMSVESWISAFGTILHLGRTIADRFL